MLNIVRVERALILCFRFWRILILAQKSDDDGEYWDAEEDYDDYDEYGSVVRFRFRF